MLFHNFGYDIWKCFEWLIGWQPCCDVIALAPYWPSHMHTQRANLAVRFFLFTGGIISFFCKNKKDWRMFKNHHFYFVPIPSEQTKRKKCVIFIKFFLIYKWAHALTILSFTLCKHIYHIKVIKYMHCFNKVVI